MNPDLPTLSRTFEDSRQFRPPDGSVYICGRSAEARSDHHAQWSADHANVTIVRVLREERDIVEVARVGRDAETIGLRSQKRLRSFVAEFSGDIVYLDITGLRHGTWAALIRGLAAEQRRLRVIYVEPAGYRMSPQPTENEIYDLSEKIEGVAPLPGFASLRRESSMGLFIPLLGFEGTRLRFLMNKFEPAGQHVFPIVGVPGFRAEYPFISYWANRGALRESQAWKKVRFAPATCPFTTLNVINRLHSENPKQSLTLAPIGTKPQALAAILFALLNPGISEIVYDHPVRKASRTEGVSRLHVYELSGLFRQ